MNMYSFIMNIEKPTCGLPVLLFFLNNPNKSRGLMSSVHATSDFIIFLQRAPPYEPILFDKC